MQINYKQIKKQFEKSMKSYDKHAIIQDFTAEKISDKISKISAQFDNVLEIGAGTGILTKHLIEKIKFKNYYANDLIEKSKSYVEKFLPEVNFICGDALKIKTEKKMDLIVSNAVFQWFSDFEKSVDILRQNLKPNGVLAFTTFLPDNFKEIKYITGLSLGYKTADELMKILSKNFEILYSESFIKELKFNTPLEVLEHMKNTGVNSLSKKSWTIKEVKEFCSKYKEIYPEIKLTYVPVLFILIARSERFSYDGA